MAKAKLKGLQKIAYMIILIAIVIAAIFLYSMYAPRTGAITMSDNSMEPTISDSQSVIVDYSYYERNPLERGDIVAFKLKTQDVPLIKRVIAIPGDSLEFSGQGILVNGAPVDEDYLPQAYDFSSGNFEVVKRMLNSDNTIPQNSVLALNDNRDNPYDSRHLGLFPLEYIIGRVIIQP